MILNLLFAILGILVLLLVLELALNSKTSQKMLERQPFMFNFLLKTSRFSSYLILVTLIILLLIVALF